MRFISLRKLHHLLIALTLSTQILGIVICGDTDCLQGDSDENCVTLLCNLLGKHSDPRPISNDNQNSSCRCFCHVLIDLPRITLHAAPFAVTPHYANEVLHLFSEPIRNIDHPPLA